MFRSRIFNHRLAGAAAACVLSLAVAPASAEDVIKVQIARAKVIELPANTTTIIIGNPVVADVTMLRKSNRMILTGKSFGSTNLIALDSGGNALGESIIQVASSFKGLVVQRGMERESWDCSPRCQPTISLGDSSRYFGETSGAISQFNSINSGAAPAAGSPTGK